MRPVLFHAEANDDLKQAILWYEKQRKGLGAEFRLAFEDVLNRAVDNPGRFPPAHKKVRCGRFKRFPYSVFYYVVRGGVLVVLAVLHQARDPNLWKKRL